MKKCNLWDTERELEFLRIPDALEAKGEKMKGNKSKSEEKDSNTGDTAGAHVEDTTTTEESTPPKGMPNIGTHVLETNVQSSISPSTVEEILQAHPIDNDDLWGNTNPTDVSINTANSEEMMAGSHITDFHTSKQEKPVTTDLFVNIVLAEDTTTKVIHNPLNPLIVNSILVRMIHFPLIQ